MTLAYPDMHLNSRQRIEFRRKALLGETIDGCSKCYEQESAGIASLRGYANQKKSIKSNTSVQLSEINSVELFLGDECNLKCVMCDPQLSSAWRKEYQDLGWALPKRPSVPNVEKIFKNFPRLNYVKFVGGEPLLSSQHKLALKTLLNQKPENITLNYCTNTTIVPDSEVVDLWSKFKEVEVWFSVDGLEGVNEYIRFPTKWRKTLEVFNEFNNIRTTINNFNFNISCTVSIYNLWSLDKFEKWYMSELKQNYPGACNYLHFNPLVQPPYLSILNLPESLKRKAILSLNIDSKIQAPIINYLKENSRDFDDRLVSYTKDLDKIRGLNVLDYIPELTPLFV